MLFGVYQHSGNNSTTTMSRQNRCNVLVDVNSSTRLGSNWVVTSRGSTFVTLS